MAIRELTCISCPLGCPLKVETDENGAVLQVTGNTCKRGEIYGKKEVTAPERTVTSTVAVVGGSAPLVSVRTRTDIPKGKISSAWRPSAPRKSRPRCTSGTWWWRTSAAPAWM